MKLITFTIPSAYELFHSKRNIEFKNSIHLHMSKPKNVEIFLHNDMFNTSLSKKLRPLTDVYNVYAPYGKFSNKRSIMCYEHELTETIYNIKSLQLSLLNSEV